MVRPNLTDQRPLGHSDLDCVQNREEEPMAFVQTISFTTSRIDEISAM